MQREIKVIANSQNKNEVYMSNAETLGELKAELLNKGYNLEDMDMKEGKSRTNLCDELQVLPCNFLYKGVETNDLVVMITPKNTKIKSGMETRASLYEQIKRYSLQEVCKTTFGRNYTQCSSQNLSDLIHTFASQSTNTSIPETLNNNTKKKEDIYTVESLAIGIYKILNLLEGVTIMGVHIFPKTICDNIRKAIRKDYTPYTVEELEEMQDIQ